LTTPAATLGTRLCARRNGPFPRPSMELGGLEPPTSWVRSTLPSSEFDMRRWRFAAPSRTGSKRPLRGDSRGLSRIPLGFRHSSRLVPEPTPTARSAVSSERRRVGSCGQGLLLLVRGGSCRWSGPRPCVHANAAATGERNLLQHLQPAKWCDRQNGATELLQSLHYDTGALHDSSDT
jgi:hypothetical protein